MQTCAPTPATTKVRSGTPTSSDLMPEEKNAVAYQSAGRDGAISLAKWKRMALGIATSD